MAKTRPRFRTEILTTKKPTTNSFSFLGLDCSSSTIGWGLLYLCKKDIILKAHGHIKPLKSNKYNLIERLDDVYQQIQNLCDEYKPTHVAIEDIVLFMSRKSHAKTITVLAGFNRVAALAAYRKVGNVHFYSVHEIRKLIKNDYLDKKTKIAKEDMPDLVREHLDKRFKGPLNTKGDLAVETYDEADGIAVAWAQAIEERGRDA